MLLAPSWYRMMRERDGNLLLLRFEHSPFRSAVSNSHRQPLLIACREQSHSSFYGSVLSSVWGSSLIFLGFPLLVFSWCVSERTETESTWSHSWLLSVCLSWPLCGCAFCLLRVPCLVFKGISFVILGLSGILVSGISVINTATKSNQGRERLIWPSHAGHGSSRSVRAGAQDGSLKQRPRRSCARLKAHAVWFLTLSGTTCSGNGVTLCGLGLSLPYPWWLSRQFLIDVSTVQTDADTFFRWLGCVKLTVHTNYDKGHICFQFSFSFLVFIY